MGQTANQEKQKEQGYTLNCWEGFLVDEPIKEYHTENKTFETIGHLWLCTRRFKPEFKGDHTKLSDKEFQSYQHPGCQSCQRELTHWKKKITVNFEKTKLSREFFRNWIIHKLKSIYENKSHTIIVGFENIPCDKFHSGFENRITEKIPKPVSDYNPNMTYEQSDIADVPF